MKYNKKNNEEQSADVAAISLQALSFPIEKINKCQQQILATASHISACSDTKYFLDADLSILGQQEILYSAYASNIRKEYSIYTDKEYNTGRKNILQHFLQRNTIYTTPYFIDALEQQARKNIRWEIETML